MTFEEAFAATMKREGGFVLHEVAGDTGGMTYAGVARNFNKAWPGWAYIDRGDVPPTTLVRQFYWEGYWLPIRGDELRPDIAASIFDFGVNAGVRTAVKLAQLVCGTQPDGVMGPKTVAALNALTEDQFKGGYFVAKMQRYAEIVNANRSQSKFLLGWLNRSLGALT